MREAQAGRNGGVPRGTGTVATFSVTAAATTFLDSTVTTRTTYYYRIRAENSVAFSAWSNTATATTTGVLTFTRIAGADRIATAIATSKKGFPAGAPAVVIVEGNDYPDALSAAPLAKAWGGPILLTQTAALRADVIAELTRLAPTRVFIVGSTLSVSANVATQLSALPSPPTVTRYSGADRYATAARIGDAVKAKLGGTVSKVVVVTGRDYHDAMIAAPLAASKGWPILLAGNGGSLPTVTSAALTRLAPTAGTLVVADTSEVTGPAFNAVPAPRTRLGFVNHYDNCGALVDYAKTQGVKVTHVALTTGTNYPDGLAAGPYLALDSGLLLLTDPLALPAPIGLRLTANKATITRLDAFGTTSAVSNAVVTQAKQALQ